MAEKIYSRDDAVRVRHRFWSMGANRDDALPHLAACPCGCPARGRRDDDGPPGWCDSCRMNIHQAYDRASGLAELAQVDEIMSALRDST